MLEPGIIASMVMNYTYGATLCVLFGLKLRRVTVNGPCYQVMHRTEQKGIDGSEDDENELLCYGRILFSFISALVKADQHVVAGLSCFRIYAYYHSV